MRYGLGLIALLATRRPSSAARTKLCSSPRRRPRELKTQPHYLRFADGSGDINTLNPHLLGKLPTRVHLVDDEAYLVK